MDKKRIFRYPRFPMPPLKLSAAFSAAFRYSIPVLLGYLAIGLAFGLLLSGAGYPWWMSLLMGLVMYAGAGQYIAVGLFSAGAGLGEACLVQLIVNARHIAYGLTMLKPFRLAGALKPYLVFSLTDETFALLSSLREGDPRREGRFMFCLALLNHGYWVTGSLLGALAGSLVPFDTRGMGFAMTALFVVLMVEQMRQVRKAPLFVLSALAAALGVILLPARGALLAALTAALLLAALGKVFRGKAARRKGHET
jgi:4-azaleucine resistance transporter AzlC